MALTPRKILAKHGMRGMCVPNSSENMIKIINNSKEVWNIKKNVQMADVRAMIEYKEALVTKVYDVSRKKFHYCIHTNRMPHALLIKENARKHIFVVLGHPHVFKDQK